MQSYPGPLAAEGALGPGFALLLAMLWLVIAGVIYFVSCFPVYMIGRKLGREDAWWAWVPVMNIILMCRIGGKPEWWTILFFVPIANIVVTVIVWMGIAVACEKPDWLGILMLIPVANIVIPFYLAFG